MTRNLLDLTGKHIFIVGGSRGIGGAAAVMAAKAGADVSISYRTEKSAADRVCSEIAKFGQRAFSFQAETGEPGAVAQAIDAAVAELGSLGGLVVSAGVFEGCYLNEMTSEFWDRTMAVNVRGTFLSVQAATTHMPQGGSIVIYTSTAGQRGSAEYSAYATSKGAQVLFMRSMAKELAPKIRVNCIAPAWTETDMAAPSLDAMGRDKVAAGFPLGRIGLPEDVAGATCFLLSDLSSFITGSTITVDGGMDMRG